MATVAVKSQSEGLQSACKLCVRGFGNSLGARRVELFGCRRAREMLGRAQSRSGVGSDSSSSEAVRQRAVAFGSCKAASGRDWEL